MNKGGGGASLTIFVTDCRFNGVFRRDNLGSAVKIGAYVINIDEYHDIGTHWVALYVNNKTITYLILLELNIFREKL